MYVHVYLYVYLREPVFCFLIFVSFNKYENRKKNNTFGFFLFAIIKYYYCEHFY